MPAFRLPRQPLIYPTLPASRQTVNDLQVFKPRKFSSLTSPGTGHGLVIVNFYGLLSSSDSPQTGDLSSVRRELHLSVRAKVIGQDRKCALADAERGRSRQLLYQTRVWVSLRRLVRVSEDATFLSPDSYKQSKLVKSCERFKILLQFGKSLAQDSVKELSEGSESVRAFNLECARISSEKTGRSLFYEVVICQRSGAKLCEVRGLELPVSNTKTRARVHLCTWSSRRWEEVRKSTALISITIRCRLLTLINSETESVFNMEEIRCR